MKKKVFTIAKVIAVLAMLVSLFLIYEHFSEGAEQFCTFGESLNCGVVNKSPYASIDGILYFLLFDAGIQVPLLNLADYGHFIDLITTNAFWGFVTFLFVFFSVRAIEKKKKCFGMDVKKQLRVLKWVLWLSILYALYLVYIELFVLKTICLFCIILDVLIVLTLVSVYLIGRMKK